MHLQSSVASSSEVPDRWWTVAREWDGETAFIVGGGPSVLEQDLDRLRGHRVIAINSSYERVPFADFLFFGDLRWWHEHRTRLVDFGGRVVTCRPGISSFNLKNGSEPILGLKRQKPPGLARSPGHVVFQRTSYSSAINLAVHLGVSRIIALGLDGKRDKDGRSHHHEPHRWTVKPNSWKEQEAELETLVQPLREAGVTLVNASPDSAVKFWPNVHLEDCLGHG